MTDLRAQLQASLAASYVLERELGRGGMATVYLAQDLKHDRPVALKVLHPELAQTLGPERFQREIQLAARLQHPHILTVLDSGRRRPGPGCGSPCRSSKGSRSATGSTRERQLPVEDALRIAREAAQALQYAHEARRDPPRHQAGEHAAHRDGNTLVADFGIARAIEPARTRRAHRDRARRSARRRT